MSDNMGSNVNSACYQCVMLLYQVGLEDKGTSTPVLALLLLFAVSTFHDTLIKALACFVKCI